MIVGSPTILNLVPGGVMKRVHVNQVNKNIEIQFKVMNGAAPYNVPEGVTCTIRGTKGDAFGYAAEAAVTAGSNVVTVTLTEQLTAVAGAGNIFELVFVGAADDMKVSTENFILAVERQAMGEDTVISDSDLSYAEQVLDQLQSVGAVNAQVQQNKANLAAEISRAQAAEAAETAARQAADNTLQSNINSEASTRATADAALQSQINQLIAPEGAAPSAAEVENARVGADGTVYSTLGDAIRGQVTDVKSALNSVIEHSEELSDTFYTVERDTYYQTDGTQKTLSGYDTYTIPVSQNDVITFEAIDNDFVSTGFSKNYIFHTVSNGTLGRVYVDGEGSHPLYYYVYASKACIFICDGSYDSIKITVYADYAQDIRVYKNTLGNHLNAHDQVKKGEIVHNVTADNTIQSRCYYTTQFVQHLNANMYSLIFPVKQNDKIQFENGYSTGFSYYGNFINNSDRSTRVNISTSDYTVPADGLVIIYKNIADNETKKCIHIPVDRLKITYSDILNPPVITNPWDGLAGVAFGTSLTYRAQTTGGFLKYLPSLSGMTFDNQGVGSSYIYGQSGTYNMLETIKGYASYSGKDVVLVEGFVNDWWGEKTLGAYTDTTENSVCGCVRSALNYIRTQNADATVFLILDHYGQNSGGVDTSSTAIRGGKTQYEFYEEIAKVAESLGVRVIKLYSESEISESTPQYYIDNIHPNADGAEQTANVIWAKIKQYYPNIVD